MRITTPTTDPSRAAADILAVAVAKPARVEGALASLDKALGGRIARLIDDGEVRGARNRVTLLHTAGDGVRARRVALVGVGRDPGHDDIRAAAGTLARTALGVRARTIAFVAESSPLDTVATTRAVVEGVALGGYRFDRYRTRDRSERAQPLTSLAVIGGNRAAARRAGLVADATNRARDLQNTPPNDLGPDELADRARAIAGAHGQVRVEVRDERWMRARGMGSFLAVARSSSRPARLITLRYSPPRARSGVVLGLVGKGITFDSGGLSLKPARAMTGMKYDMSGAAAVLEATDAIAGLGLPLKVVTVVGATENMIDAGAYKVDEVVTAMNGKTIEVTNTDAEGRLVLADCLHYARTQGVTHLVDVATLTGAVIVALGDYFAGVMGGDDEFMAQVTAAGERSGEHVWRLPVHDTLRRLMRSNIADMANAGTAGVAGSIFAARFLQEFAGEGQWAHVDIAGTADLSRSREDEFPASGGTGFGVRLLVELAESLC
jgi:leucyl aminopeptidase